MAWHSVSESEVEQILQTLHEKIKNIGGYLGYVLHEFSHLQLFRKVHFFFFFFLQIFKFFPAETAANNGNEDVTKVEKIALAV